VLTPGEFGEEQDVERTSTVVTSAEVPRPHIRPTGVPSVVRERKLSASSQREPTSRFAPESQMDCWPLAQ
jgi:hypothetical protein